MKLDKGIFEALEAEKSKHDKASFVLDTAITSLRALCDHVWVASPSHGFGVDDYYCESCGMFKGIEV